MSSFKCLPLLLLTFAWLASLASPVMAQDADPTAETPPVEQAAPGAEILSPAGGQALQGVVAIFGTAGGAGFRSAEVSFAFQDDPTATWFLLRQLPGPLEGALAEWDTSTISDGVYALRLQVFLEDGQVQEAIVSGLRVRNYSPVETSTPTAAPAVTVTAPGDGQPAGPTPLPSATPAMFTPVERTPTPLPTNPAELTAQDLGRSALQGVLVVFGGLLLAAGYMGLRGLFRR
jgi:hypothetical protein